VGALCSRFVVGAADDEVFQQQMPEPLPSSFQAGLPADRFRPATQPGVR